MLIKINSSIHFSKDSLYINCEKFTYQIFQQAAEIRLQKEKEKEILPVVNTSSSIWSSQNISWGNPSFPNSQWSSSTGRYRDNLIHFQVANY